MSAAAIFYMPVTFKLQSSGRAYPSAKLEFFETGTTTPKDVFTDADLSIAYSQPIEADSSGFFTTIYLDPAQTYKYTLSTSADVLIETVDPGFLPPISQAVIGALLYPQTTAETGAGVTPTKYYYPPGHILRYGAVGDGVTDNADSIDDAIAQMEETGGAEIYFPLGTYCTSRTHTVSVHAMCRIRGDDWPFAEIKWTTAVDGLVVKSNHASIIGIKLNGNSIGLKGLVEQNSAQGVFERVECQGWTADGFHISTTYASPTGNCNFARHIFCTSTLNAGWGFKMPSVQGDQNALEFISCNASGNTLGGNLIKGQACVVSGGLYEGNSGPGVSLGDDTDVIVVSKNKVILPYLESNTTGVYAGATSVGNYILIDKLNANSDYTHHANAENLAIWPGNNSGGVMSFGEAAQMLSIYNTRSGGNRVQLVAEGTDSNIPLYLLGKGTGGTNVEANGSGYLGFYAVTPIQRPTTGVAAATFVANAGTAVNDASTFDGYTLKQVVKALRNLGLLT